MKICTCCKKSKQLILFGKNKNKKDGLFTFCKECECLKRKNRTEDQILRRKQRLITYRKEKREFISNNSKKSYEINKESRKKQVNDYRIANLELILERKKAFYEKNKKSIRDSQNKYNMANKEIVDAIKAKYRACKLQRTPPWLTSEHTKQIRAFYKEATRLFKETGIKHHVDHIIPLQGIEISGLHVPWNLQILTASENCSKSNKLIP